MSILPDKTVGIRYQPGVGQLLQGSVAIPAAPPALRSNLSALREESLSPALQQENKTLFQGLVIIVQVTRTSSLQFEHF